LSAIDNPLHDQEVGSADATQDTTRIDDVRIGAVRPLISPALLQDELPVPPSVQTLVEKTRTEIADILHGRDDRLVMIVGPCSIHDHDQAIEYAHKLKVAADTYKDDLLIVMRVYFEKPRTTVGWKGYINDPRLDGSFRINEGLRLARQLLLDINGLGLSTATEFLDLLSPQYIADLIAWGAIGARTTESQSHRQLASGLSCPIGFKNGTDGGVQIAADAIVAARASHAFMGMTKMGMAAIFETRGNDDAHVILRGGKKGPNYDSASVEATCVALKSAGLREQVMVAFASTGGGAGSGAAVVAARAPHHRRHAGKSSGRRPSGSEARCAVASRRIDHGCLRQLGADRAGARDARRGHPQTSRRLSASRDASAESGNPPGSPLGESTKTHAPHQPPIDPPYRGWAARDSSRPMHRSPRAGLARVDAPA
jgi:3-deoxy-7-phosphoheptulonate synthase